MKRQWENEELIEHWMLSAWDLAQLGNKTGATRLAFAMLLKFFQREGRFPRNRLPHPQKKRSRILSNTCASDSKKFGAWNQNLLTKWHIRYRGPGIMIYWHVEKKSTCIYSQLKSCSSSEVAAMIEGLLRHCTDAEIEKNYVDTHGHRVM